MLSQSEKQELRPPRELPIGCEVDESSGRFVSIKTMYQIRANILRKISVRMKGEGETLEEQVLRTP